jgi:hypothetical protein
MPDVLPANLKKVADVPHHELFVPETADDILIVIPEKGFKDTAEVSRVTATALQDYARKLGKKCGLVIIANNLLAQEPESRRVYAEKVTTDLFFGITMVVTSPLARAIGNVALHMRAMQVPLTLVENVAAGVAWLESKRNA